MESHGLVDAIQCTDTTAALLADGFVLKERGMVEIKGKGPMRTFFLEGRRAAGAGAAAPDVPLRAASST
jgi:hypothetical protein